MTKIAYIPLGVILGVVSIQAQVQQHLEREVHKIITFDSEIDFTRTPGLMVGLVWEDSSYCFSYGVASKEDSLPLDAGRFFEIGELTQLYTSALTVKLAQEGHFSLDESLVGLLELESVSEASRAITLRHCLQHTAGLPRLLPGFGDLEGTVEDPYAKVTKDQLLEFLEDFQPEKAPPLSYSFSNLNYAFLALALEHKMGQRFETLLQEQLLDPLGLENTFLSMTDSLGARFAQGYNAAGKPVAPWTPSAFDAALGLRTNAEDLLTFLKHLLDPEMAWKLVFSELYADPIPTGIRKNTWMGYGWHLVYHKKKVRVLVHTGSTGGYMAYMALRPETGTGVFVLTNSPYGTKGLGMLVLGMLNENWKK
jgi:beta-lactamase class C